MNKTTKNLTIKNIIHEIADSNCELDRVWDTFYRLYCLGFISREAWNKISDTCKGYYYNEKDGFIHDRNNDNKIVDTWNIF